MIFRLQHNVRVYNDDQRVAVMKGLFRVCLSILLLSVSNSEGGFKIHTKISVISYFKSRDRCFE